MTDEELTEVLATEVMGKEWIEKNTINRELKLDCECGYEFVYFNPLEHASHFRMLEERLMEDGKSELMKNYLKWFDGKQHYMGADLKEKAQALIAALQATTPKEL